MGSNKLAVVICGGGNGAHALAGIAGSKDDVEARVLTLFADEAERWTNTMKTNDFVVNFTENGSSLKAKPALVTKDPKVAGEGCHIIYLVVPAFGHRQYLEALKPYCRKGTIIAAMPGAPGFEFEVREILGKQLANDCILMSFESLPWACRITEYGKGVDVLGVKGFMKGSMHGEGGPTVLGNSPLEAVTYGQGSLGNRPTLICKGHLLGTTLIAINSYLHTTIMYGRWHDWDGKPLAEKPLFYNGLDEATAKMLEDVSQEIQNIAREIEKQKPGTDLSQVVSVRDWYLDTWPNHIPDKTSIYTILRTHKSYPGLVHPMEPSKDGNGFVPLFTQRYLTEDIPFGLTVTRGIAEIVGVPTPNIDKIILWAQGVMGKEYMVDGKMAGKDIGETRSPQRYGLKTVDDLLG
ncbi:tauropine dehydrogenase [Lingula anatina]|uniref:Tauropine dehydrogenase n=1 Tax=Lingula anatina TaxID=7574 RepID=A0A1S3HDT5_LINAN|nr:tauropine dehydrogenase [Lingula anatina]XP_013384203.1 tauropine dehydrogenase [Lingula anatina]XP_013384204.1 tauropine dehydrogenase [Lingula anatina]|eukprot:XP_013384202.1 tauropine dehydrogenase [Lingula anatina]